MSIVLCVHFQVKDSLHQILNQTKEELSDVIDDNALESHEKHEQMVW